MFWTLYSENCMFCGTTGISLSSSLVQHPAAETIIFALII